MDGQGGCVRKASAVNGQDDPLKLKAIRLGNVTEGLYNWKT